MGHVVLLGDSIFENSAYVKSQPSVLEPLRRALPAGWPATLAAVDGVAHSRSVLSSRVWTKARHTCS